MKTHLISALYSFATAFLLVAIPAIGELSVEEVKMGAMWGVLFAGLRAGLKALIPSIHALYLAYKK